MRKVNAGDTDIHYVTVGQGPDVVMLHGFLGNLAVWHLRMVPQLRHDYRLITYDLRGHGFSQVTPTGYTTENMARDLKHVLDGLGIERAHLVGHSYGADVCLHFALLHPDRVDRLVAVEPGLAALIDERKSEEWPGWAYWATKLEEVGVTVPPERRADLDYLLEASLEAPKFFGPARGLPRNRDALIHLIKNTTLLRDYEHVGSLTREAIGTIRTETLLVYGEHSHFLGTYHYLREHLVNCTSRILPSGEHFGPLEHPDLLARHIREFLGRPHGARLSPIRAALRRSARRRALVRRVAAPGGGHRSSTSRFPRPGFRRGRCRP